MVAGTPRQCWQRSDAGMSQSDILVAQMRRRPAGRSLYSLLDPGRFLPAIELSPALELGGEGVLDLRASSPVRLDPLAPFAVIVRVRHALGERMLCPLEGFDLIRKRVELAPVGGR